MNERIDKALQMFRSGYNCAQVVLITYCEKYGLDYGTALKLADGLAHGMKRVEVCGTASGAVLVLGLKYGDTLPKEKNLEKPAHEKIAAFMLEFQKRNKHLRCEDILGYDVTTPEGMAEHARGNYKETKCSAIIADTMALLEEYGV